MENGQFQRLLHEIAESRQHTDEVAASLRDELRRHTDQTALSWRDEMRSGAEETRRYFGVVAESLRHNDQLLAEGFATLDGKIDRLGADLRTEIVETRAMIKLSYVELDRRLSSLEASRAQ